MARILAFIMMISIISSCHETKGKKFDFDYHCNESLVLDSIYVSMLSYDGVLGSILKSMAQSAYHGTEVKYIDLIKSYEDLVLKMSDQGRQELREGQHATNIISTLKVNYADWDKQIKILEKAGIPKDEFDKIKEQVKENQGRDITYIELFKEMNSKPEVREIKNRLSNLSKDELLHLNETTDKNILILFSAHGSDNSVKFEELILTNPQIIDIINSKYQVIELNCDDTTKLPESEIYKFKDGIVKTYGQRNSHFQISEFKVDTFPLMVKMSKEGKYSKPFGYTGLSDFLQFLNN